MKKTLASFLCIVLCFSLVGCTTTTDDSVSTADDARVSSITDATSTDYVFEEISTECHTEEYYKSLSFTNDETIEYGEIYNSNGILVTTKDYIHTDEDCYVKVEIKNNSEHDLIFEEKSYAVNYLNYYGSQLNYKYNDDLDKLTINKGATGVAKLKIRDIINQLGYRYVSYICFLFFAYDKNDKQKYDEIFFEIKTSKYDGIPKYIEYPTIYSDKYFSYELAYYQPSKKTNKYETQINIFNKTDKWFYVTTGDVLYNDIVATMDTNYTGKYFEYNTLNGDYYITPRSFYIFPYSKNGILFELHNKKFLDNNDIEDITNIGLSFQFYPEYNKKFKFDSDNINFNPQDYKNE